ncbi:MAG: hypothetical protein GY810_31550 [Aureispira sp.]|nr:hypothetical protein [Aureispira sp.]
MTNKEKIDTLEQKIAAFEEQEKNNNQKKIDALERKISDLGQNPSKKPTTAIKKLFTINSETLKISVITGASYGFITAFSINNIFVWAVPIIIIILTALKFYYKKQNKQVWALAAYRVSIYWCFYGFLLFLLWRFPF